MTEDQERRHMQVVLDLLIALLEVEIRHAAPPPEAPVRPRTLHPSWLARKAS